MYVNILASVRVIRGESGSFKRGDGRSETLVRESGSTIFSSWREGIKSLCINELVLRGESEEDA